MRAFERPIALFSYQIAIASVHVFGYSCSFTLKCVLSSCGIGKQKTLPLDTEQQYIRRNVIFT